MIFTELLPLNAFSLETLTLLALDAVQPAGNELLPSKSAQMIWPLSQPAPDELELLELDDELLELEEELLELEELLDELELLELDEELLELELELELDELPELDPLPPQAARANDVRITGINLFIYLPQLLLFGRSALVQLRRCRNPDSTPASCSYFNDSVLPEVSADCDGAREIELLYMSIKG